MSRLKQIIDSYLSWPQPRAIRKDFADWFLSPTDRELKHQVLQEHWDALCPDVPQSQIRRAYAQTKERIDRRASQLPARRPLLLRVARIAALLAVPVLTAALTYIITSHSLVPKTEWQEAYAPYGQTRSVTLSDGSTIIINSGSRLIYPARFSGDERRVFLSGGAYADIAKDAKHGFVLSANDVDILVHGTSFNISAYTDNSEVEVALLSGSIDMQTKNLPKNCSVRMVPGDLTKLDKRSGQTSSIRFPSGMLSNSIKDNSLTFLDSRLSDIVLQLERTFNVKIMIDDARLADERYYSAFVNHESLEQILSTLQANGKMHSRRIGDAIHLYR